MSTPIEPELLVPMDECIRINDTINHPTTRVMNCSPDPVLTRDGQTSQACRRCLCGRAAYHVDDCQRPEQIERRERERRLQEAVNRAPINLTDLLAPLSAHRPQHSKMGDHWYWCRRHTRAEHVGWAMDGCIRVGPFMTEREADRLADRHPEFPEGDRPLGMEVES